MGRQSSRAEPARQLLRRWPADHAERGGGSSRVTTEQRRCQLGRPESSQHRLDEVRSVVAEPGDPLVAPEPGVLPASELAGPGDGLGPRLVLGQLAVEETQDLRIAEPARCGQPLPQSVLRQPLRTSATNPGRPHRVHPLGDPGVQARPVEVEPDLHAHREADSAAPAARRVRCLRSARSPPAPGPPAGRCPAGSPPQRPDRGAASRACSAAGPSSASSASRPARSSGSVPGKRKSSSTARR